MALLTTIAITVQLGWLHLTHYTYGRKCRSPVNWEELGEMRLIGPEWVEQPIGIMNINRERMKIAHDRQKSYADKKRKELEFQIKDKLFLGICPSRGIMRF